MAVAAAPVGRLDGHEPGDRVVRPRRVGRVGDQPCVQREPELLRLDPCALGLRSQRLGAAAQVVAEGEERGIRTVGVAIVVRGGPVLGAVGSGEQHRRGVVVLRDDAEVVQGAPRDEGDRRRGRAHESVDRGAGVRAHPRRHRLVDQRREGAVEVERHQQTLGPRERGDGRSEAHDRAFTASRSVRKRRDQSATS